MERKFYTNDFEQLLKENADQFKMMPSKKVWHGIYNDIHPGRRWPSITMSLLFVFTIVLVGHLNTEQTKPRYSYLPKVQKTVESKNYGLSYTQNMPATSSAPIDATPEKIELSSKTEVARYNQLTESFKNETNEKAKQSSVVLPIVSNAVNENLFVQKVTPASQPDNKELAINTEIADPQYINTPIADMLQNNNAVETTSVNQIKTTNISPALNSSSLVNNSNEPKNYTTDQTVNPKQTTSKTTKALNVKIRRNHKIDWTYYISPTVSYRTYSKNGDEADQRMLGYIGNTQNVGFNRSITHSPSAGLEIGTAMKYSLSKKLKFTSGFQANYSSYRIQANNVHPIISTLILHNEKTSTPYAISSISYFGNGPGVVPVMLRNYSLQVSLPIGFEYQLAGNNQIQLSAAANIQPSFVVANHAYILSTDKRNYVTEPSLSRRWNMSSNFGTYISFNSHKFKWQLGPQVRYQLLSSYGNEYHVREHFIDYGIRLGVSKIIK